MKISIGKIGKKPELQMTVRQLASLIHLVDLGFKSMEQIDAKDFHQGHIRRFKKAWMKSLQEAMPHSNRWKRMI